MTDKEKVDLLMIPRIRVEHLYPRMDEDEVNIGDILHLQEFGFKNFFYCKLNNIGAVGVFPADIADACIANGSNIFRKLGWWEYREESEMPEYVKFVQESKLGNMILKVIKWEISNCQHDYFASAYGLFGLQYTVPVTLEEYQSLRNKTTLK